jgi:RHH-type proline utilization regulon transcriptional repressor/proline dehydrogenase/delta 1-pyrroline-5-carboxylate dehydrogenase
MIDAVAAIGRARGLRFMVRLVKGAYWDGEIKRAQELGLDGYPVFTHKHHTDISYLACAQALIGHAEVILPQFATHNAGTIAAIVGMDGARRRPAAGPALRDAAPARHGRRRLPRGDEGPCPRCAARLRAGGRAPRPAGLPGAPAAGERRQLVLRAPAGRRRRWAPSCCCAAPLQPAVVPGLPAPVALYGPAAPTAAGVDLACPSSAPLLAAVAAPLPCRGGRGHARRRGRGDGPPAGRLRRPGVRSRWPSAPPMVAPRRRQLLEARSCRASAACWCAEAGKTLGDAVAEVREAVDFCRYYAQQAGREAGSPSPCPAPPAKATSCACTAAACSSASRRGTSRWRSSPARWWPHWWPAMPWPPSRPSRHRAWRQRFVALLHEAGVPADALALLHGPGETVGAQLVAHPRHRRRVLHRQHPGGQADPAQPGGQATAPSCR